MSDIPVFQRRGYSANAVQTTLQGDITSSATAMTVADGSTYPATNFFIALDLGSQTIEDVVFVETRTGNSFGGLHGLDFDHSSGATVAAVFTAQDADEANALVATLQTRGDLITRGDADGPQRLPVGANGLPLVAKDSASLGLAYTQLGPGALAALSLQGAMFAAGASGVVGELAPGDNLTVLQRNTSAPLGVSWTDIGLGAWLDWTPTISQSAAATGLTYTKNYGRYTKIGRTIIAYFDVTFTSAGTAGQPIFVSLPVTAAAARGIGGMTRYDDVSVAPNENWGATPQYSAFTTLVAFSDLRTGASLGINPPVTVASGDFFNGFLIYEASA